MACADFDWCEVDRDCESTVCALGTCQPPSCVDAVRNGEESDVDCGGRCDGCLPGRACASPDDCASLLCTSRICGAWSCTDGLDNGFETDVDCGGRECSRCAIGLQCRAAVDCESLACDASTSTCVDPSCDDGTHNANETDVDCGGPDCPECAPGMACVEASDCASSVCVADT